MSTDSVRQHWMSVLAHSDPERLQTQWQSLGITPNYRLIRPPEVGMIQVQARMGGEGQRFFMGDVTVTRAVVQLSEHSAPSSYGYSYVIGRNKPHAELSALIDALLQRPSLHRQLQNALIEPLYDQLLSLRKQRAQAIAASQVDFFTLVRGED
ncbi:methylphosphonate degradation complex subunit PhnG [Samsonia erythrinae]|uniref:Methylphosphonate degradation complex subunit PhnG n=2 Tax=Samsonia erythrinae TaxID=160434 RepID=A0A4R3VTN1_9GAMM|nr:phosphonate C-P lyase system protein PhnG [Samsonia erythrinae]TCV08612.1 methylphosphonate degradation complex subunit PhnG [Samsonia erythrinae]